MRFLSATLNFSEAPFYIYIKTSEYKKHQKSFKLKTQSSYCENTCWPGARVLLLPAVQQDVEVSRTLKEAKVARRWRRWENSLKLSAATELVFALCQHTDVLRGQDVQHCGEEVLAETGGQLLFDKKHLFDASVAAHKRWPRTTFAFSDNLHKLNKCLKT